MKHNGITTLRQYKDMGYDLLKAFKDLKEVENEMKNLSFEETFRKLNGIDFETKVISDTYIKSKFSFIRDNYDAEVKESVYMDKDLIIEERHIYIDGSIFIDHCEDWNTKEQLEIDYSNISYLVLEDFYEQNKNNTHTKIGMLIYDDNNNPIGIIKDNTQQGEVFKDQEAYETSLDKICYISEYGDLESFYTKQGFLDITNGNQRQADILFDMVDWQFPESLYEELEFSDFEDDCDCEDEEDSEW